MSKEKQVTLESLAENAKRITNEGKCLPSGYRVKVLPLATSKGLEGAMAQAAPTLAALGFEEKTARQVEREDKGADVAIVVAVGEFAFTGPMIKHHVPWVEEGDVIRYMRYAGSVYEEPPGSGIKYRIINDEDVLGVYEEKAYEQ